MNSETPSRGEPAAAACPVCTRLFTPGTNQHYCSKVCRDTAWRRRHSQPRPQIAVPAGRPRRPVTVYECAACGTRSLGEQRCEECGSFMARVGFGGRCPHCDDVVALADLVGEEVVTENFG